ncbi:MerR family transcriptional regulator [Nesterenkonia sp. PF2B19]|uniref:MerR family transcriptional regulator n=1 Tax=unclassified Nesterenkonia TaxID=2629769 RepID=UPI0008729EDE|nr:MerR family transcriptional regulator [Nesterenkonia sp. PF2B19]OSM42005.1 transcriptional regulator [Nesterenkonia sp. PF2B19]
MRISEVTARTGVPATTLRYYEDLGLITSQRGPNGYRDYDQTVIDQLEFIATAKKLDLDLEEIRWLSQVIATGTCTAVRENLRPVLADRLAHVEENIQRLTRMRALITEALNHVVSCPDSDQPCKSECAFQSLAKMG